ncbi:Phosphotyrosyl phosphatase activator [Macrolepiota fuliginosa MF-IS2]|uniref:Serine/threonine-protein phosphatase 2A activator n=1 Tax=Macrolepiota fuliginosa MF-IS2 TaxID=1400762 RepID=A0A9P6C252_9AGAR|nr:Phosphotyrosyl phosphatase activator [Macrolepiota fuliginosa MF-IS2]
MDLELSPLRQISPTQFRNLGSPPSLVIKSDEDVERWKNTLSYYDYDLFLRRLNESIVGLMLPWSAEIVPESVTQIMALLDTLDGWVEDIPPLNIPQRFGNLAFRTWGARLEERADELLDSLLPPDHKTLVPFIKPYFLTSFGSFTRMDYGTGHETSFTLFLLCLTLVRFFQPTPDEERHLVLSIFARYLRLCWKLQDAYKLEPAGSHGVWGLDDYSFLPYIFGSGQLRGQTAIPPSAILHPPLPATNLYFLAIIRIHDVKQGPFFEHSSQLYSIATGVPNWGKVNSGLFKMYRAEVLGKRVVVQHIPLGGLLEWETTVTEIPPASMAQISRTHLTTNSGLLSMDNPDPRSINPERRTWQPPATRQAASPRHATLTGSMPPPVDYIRKQSTGSTTKHDNVGGESDLS